MTQIELMRIEADQICVDYNGTVALYDASLHLPQRQQRYDTQG